jgi:hypothetical protein
MAAPAEVQRGGKHKSRHPACPLGIRASQEVPAARPVGAGPEVEPLSAGFPASLPPDPAEAPVLQPRPVSWCVARPPG